MQPLLVEFIGAIVRWGLTIFGAALVSKHVITVDQAQRFTNGFAPELAGAVLVAGPLAWSLAHKWYAKTVLDAARELPPGASDEQLRDRTRDLMMRPGG